MSYLIIERGPNAGTRLPLNHFPITIGRDPENDVYLQDTEVSRFHLRIKQRGKLFIMEDLESKNGSYVNGEKILNSIIQNGDKILIGETELLFVTQQSGIQITQEIQGFDILISEQLGITGPVDVRLNPDENTFKPIRLSPVKGVKEFLEDHDAVVKIFDHHSNLLVIKDLDEAARAVLKSVGQILEKASRACFFIWSNSTRQLIPIAAKQYSNQKVPFLLSQRSLEDVISRKQDLLLKAKFAKVTQPGRNRLILPMIHNEELICVLHVESDDPRVEFSTRELELVRALLHRIAPSFESMLLRRELDSWLVGMIETMIATVEAKDTYTRGHSERVSRYAMAIADELKLNRELKRLLLISSLCHDIGKIGIPDSILKKAAILSAEEYDEMKLHPTIGAEIINHMPNAKRFLSGIKHHHEKWDGTGYPDALAGEEIPFFARIVAISDVFDAMVSGRSYAGFMDQAEAVERLSGETDLFDPEIFKAFVRAFENGTLTIKTSTDKNQNPNEPVDEPNPIDELKNPTTTAKQKIKKSS